MARIKVVNRPPRKYILLLLTLLSSQCLFVPTSASVYNRFVLTSNFQPFCDTFNAQM